MAHELSEQQIVAIGKISHYLNEKYKAAPDTIGNLNSFREEAEALFEAVDVEVQVTTILAGYPQIEVVGSKVPLDLEKNAYDIRRGLADDYWKRARRKMELARKAANN